MPSATKNKNAFIWVWLSAFIIFLDQFSKYLVNHHLLYAQPLRLTPFFNLSLNYNPGAAFGSFQFASGWQVFLLSGISIIVAIILALWLLRTPRRDWMMALALSLILGGALGNLIDRLRFNYVIDFFDFHLGAWHFATFNFADSAICVGAAFLIIRVLFVKKP